MSKRLTAASSSTGSWAAWGLPAGTGQAMGPGRHHPGWRHWVPGTANQLRCLALRRAHRLTGARRPQDQPNRQPPYPSALACRRSKDVQGVRGCPRVQVGVCMPQGGPRCGTWHPRCMSEVSKVSKVKVSKVQGIQGPRYPRCMSKVQCRYPWTVDKVYHMCGVITKADSSKNSKVFRSIASNTAREWTTQDTPIHHVSAYGSQRHLDCAKGA